MFSRSYLALLAIGKTGGKQRTSETSKKKTMCTFTPTGTSSGCYICCCSYNSGGEFGCIWGSRRLRRYQNLRAAPARKLHRLAENKGVRGGQDVKGSQSIKHKQPTANKKKKKAQGQRRQEAERLVAQEQYSRRITRQRQLQRKLKNWKTKQYKKSTSAMVQFSLLGLIFIFFIFMAIAQMHQRPQLFLRPYVDISSVSR